MHWIIEHKALFAALGTWVFNNLVTVLISELPAPSRDSSTKYVYWFKVANRVIGNTSRARSTAIEGSPNWSDAVTQHVDMLRNMGAKIPEASQDTAPTP